MAGTARRTLLRAALGSAATGVAAACAGRDDPSGPAAAGAPRDAGRPGGTGVVPGWLVTDWAADPWALGSYTHLPVGATPEDRRALARPAWPLVLAGEATSVDAPATVHGALSSGRRAARQVSRRFGSGRRIVVVGAGAAGLGAAAELRDAHDVVVLEARDTWGGRVRTDRSLGVPLELGASWVHGPVGNPLVPLARRAGVELVTTDWDDAVLRGPDGAVVDASAAESDAAAALAGAADLGERSDVDVPLGELVRQALARRPRADPAAVARVLTTEVGHELGASPEELSGWWWDEGAATRGGDALVVGGYDRVLAPLAEGLDLRTSSPVRAVRWSPDGATVDTDAGALDADAVVVTVPVAVLRAGVVAFDPPLPPPWAASLARLGTGLLDKVVLTTTAPPPDDAPAILQWWAPEPGTLAEWVDLRVAAGVPAVMGFHAADAARRWSGRPPAELAGAAAAALDLLAPGWT